MESYAISKCNRVENIVSIFYCKEGLFIIVRVVLEKNSVMMEVTGRDRIKFFKRPVMPNVVNPASSHGGVRFNKVELTQSESDVIRRRRREGAAAEVMSHHRQTHNTSGITYLLFDCCVWLILIIIAHMTFLSNFSGHLSGWVLSVLSFFLL